MTRNRMAMTIAMIFVVFILRPPFFAGILGGFVDQTLLFILKSFVIFITLFIY